MRDTKKLLLLTLGTGKLSDTNEAEYISVQYTFEGKDYKKNIDDIEGTKTNFVAEPLIDLVKPDDIYILGTVKSVWHRFYASLITENNEDLSYMENKDYLQLLNMEKQYGVTTSKEKLLELEQEISTAFAHIPSWKRFPRSYKDKRPEIHIWLTKYGINEKELIENYDILKRIENSLEERYRYEISFDITHSFRSLPIYNLVILNYIKNITKYQIAIKHIYYGNVEVRSELNEKAPIVDLYDLAHILDLTNGVTEFKDTGNSVTLLNMLSEDDELKETLKKFDIAMQLNAFDKIKTELKELCKLIPEKSDDSRYTGVREMIHTVLEEKFFDKEGSNILEVNNMSDADLKFLLAQWFFNQNRNGLGLATGLEALRDITTPAFMRARRLVKGEERKYREGAEKYFIDIAAELKKKEEHTPLEKVVCSLGGKLKDYKEIRNIFAHSLHDKTEADLDQIGADIQKFKTDLFKLKKIYDQNQTEFVKLFKIKIIQQSQQLKEPIKAILVFGQEEGDEDWVTILKTYEDLTLKKIFYSDADMLSEYMKDDQTGKERKEFRKSMRSYIDNCIQKYGLSKKELIVVLKSTEYIKQTEIINDLSHHEYDCRLYVCPEGKNVGLRKI